MRNTYTNEIAELHKWVENTDYQLGTGFPFLHTEAEVHIVCQRICFIASYIQEEYPFYSSQLPIISTPDIISHCEVCSFLSHLCLLVRL